jgi:hypothetical protein
VGTCDEVKYVYDAAQRLLRERELDYEGSWKREGLGCMAASLYRKASGLEVAFRNGNWATRPVKTKEDLLDLMNYCALVYRLTELEGGK